MNMEKEQSELQALIIKLFPPHDYGEDSNVEELYNRCTDLESEVERLQAQVGKARILLLRANTYVSEVPLLGEDVKSYLDKSLTD